MKQPLQKIQHRAFSRSSQSSTTRPNGAIGGIGGRRLRSRSTSAEGSSGRDAAAAKANGWSVLSSLRADLSRGGKVSEAQKK